MIGLGLGYSVDNHFINIIMGNQNQRVRDNRKRRGGAAFASIQQSSFKNKSNRKFYNNNQSLEVGSVHDARNASKDDGDRDDSKDVYSERRKNKSNEERDKVLKKLGIKNEQLRRELKKISDELTQKLQHKKFVPKKKIGLDNDNQKQDVKQANTAGLRRQLQNGYKQIEMYKRTIGSLKGKEQTDQSDNRVKRLENNVRSIDDQINVFIKKIEGVKKVNKNQGKTIQKDINEELIGGVQSMKREAQQLKKGFKKLQERQRQREVNYKKQQAYLCQVQKKCRQMNNEYFPELKSKSKSNQPPPIHHSRAETYKKKDKEDKSSNPVSQAEYQAAQQQLQSLKRKHEQYNHRIQVLIQQKNRVIDQRTSLQQNHKYSDKIIQTLKLKLIQMKKIFKPNKKTLFGYDNYNGTELQSQYNGGIDQIQKEIQYQVNQDQFDIKHLIANIPKPARPKFVVEFQEKPSKEMEKKKHIPGEVNEKGGMIISGQKSEPKKWGSSLTRTDQKGRQVRKQATFNDSSHFLQEVKPLIIGINVWVNKNNAIMGLQAIYLNGQQIRYGTKSSQHADGFLQRYDLQNPDYLKNITGAFGQDGYLEYLVLYSKQGKIGTYGFKVEGQEPFTFGLSSSERPFIIFGATFVYDAEPRINRLGIQICQEEGLS